MPRALPGRARLPCLPRAYTMLCHVPASVSLLCECSQLLCLLLGSGKDIDKETRNLLRMNVLANAEYQLAGGGDLYIAGYVSV